MSSFINLLTAKITNLFVTKINGNVYPPPVSSIIIPVNNLAAGTGNLNPPLKDSGLNFSPPNSNLGTGGYVLDLNPVIIDTTQHQIISANVTPADFSFIRNTENMTITNEMIIGSVTGSLNPGGTDNNVLLLSQSSAGTSLLSINNLDGAGTVFVNGNTIETMTDNLTLNINSSSGADKQVLTANGDGSSVIGKMLLVEVEVLVLLMK